MKFLDFIILPTLLILLGGISSAILSYYSARKTKNTQKNLSVGMLFASLIVIVGGLLSGYSNYKKSLLIDSKTDQIIAVSKDNTELGKQIAELSKQNRKLNEYTINSITGGTSFCYYVIAIGPSLSDKCFLRMLMHSGEFPLFDLSIRIHDSYKNSKIIKSGNWNYDSFKDAEEILKKTTFFKYSQGNPFEDFSEVFCLPEETDEQRYSIFFTARNGDWHQTVKFRKINGKWKWATKVTRVNVVLDQYIHPDFPKDKDGNVLW
jgi:hypothetical protein